MMTPAEGVRDGRDDRAEQDREEPEAFALYRDDHPIAYLPTLAACRSLIRFEQRKWPKATFRVYRSVVR